MTVAADIASLDAAFHIGSLLRVVEEDQRGIVAIQTDDCQARIALQGAQVLSWAPRGQADLLWCAPLPAVGTGKAIRGGIPICWPWFGPHVSDPRQPQHGLVRTVDWRLAATELTQAGVKVVLEIEMAGALVLVEVVAGSKLDVALVTRNLGSAQLSVTEALHTYFCVGDAAGAAVVGLDGCAYRDNTDGGREKTWSGVCRMDRETIAVFDVAPDVTEIADPALGRRITIRRAGGKSTIAWHPGENITPLADVVPGTQASFVCVESGNVGASRLSIAPGADHRLAVTYSIAAL